MFRECIAFDQPISFDTSQVETMASMFQGCAAFNQPILFDTSLVTTMDSMFQDAVSFATPLNTWNLNSLVSMNQIFTHCGFNQSVYSATLNGWASQSLYLLSNVDVGTVSDSNNALICHTNALQAYNTLIGLGWSILDGGYCADMIITVNVPATTTITLEVNSNATVDWTQSGVFTSVLTHTYTDSGIYTISINGATRFNYSATLNPYLFSVVQWDDDIIDYSTAFQNCPYNFTLPSTQLTGVTNMLGMFTGCSAFNQPISFNTSLVTTMQSMFEDCHNFNKPITISIQGLTAGTLGVLSSSLQNIFYKCGISTSNYSATLMSWAAQTPNYINVGQVSDPSGNLIQHTADTAYVELTNTPPGGHGWSITDGPSEDVPCFLKGTHILTPNGYVRIEKLHAGDLVLTHDGRKVPICKMHRSHPRISSITLPYCIPRGTQVHSTRCLDDLYLSPKHAILINPTTMLAIKYTKFQQVKVESIHYYHIVLPNYYTDTLIANGIVCESYGSAKKYNLHYGKYRTLISPHTYYNITEPSQYKLM
jgi:hypothetical protein